MSSAGITLSGSSDYWKGTDYIERKLGSVLDKKVASSTKQVLVDRIKFKEASKPDPFYVELKSHYIPLNSSSDKRQVGDPNVVATNGKQGYDCDKPKDELPTPKFILFERHKIHLQWKNIRRVGPGLFNLGNTCFLNSVIQVLTYTPPLVNYLATQEHSKTCRTVGFCMLCELQRHVLRTFGHNQSEAIKPMAIIQKLKYIAKHLRFGHQEDSHEFLRYVIDGMLKSCLAGVSEKLDLYTKATTMVHQIFGGYFRSQVTCERCQHTSNTYDPLMEILLDIKQAHSITKALHRLISVELLNGDNMYLCPRCKKKVRAKKRLTVHRPPNVMTVCLKRFDCHSLFGTKLNKEVVYPEQLNLRPFMSKAQGPPVKYKLYAVLVHSGYSCNSGHYYCFIKASNGGWYQMNDSTVRQVGLKTVLSQQAYLLFYIRDQNTQKELPQKSNRETQHVQSPSVNGVTSWKPGTINSAKHAPKIIGESVKANKVPGYPVPGKPGFSAKDNGNTSDKQFAPVATTLPQTREKVSFTLNHGVAPKKTVSSTTEDKKHVVKAEEQSSTLSGSSNLVDNRNQNLPNVECTTNVEQKVEVTDQSSHVQDKHTAEWENVVKPSETVSVTEQVSSKDGVQETSDVHATTKWKVTTHSVGPLLPGGLSGFQRERTPSLSSDISNACSIASKTGEWSVTDRNATQDVGPKLPERQHAGWKVSTAEHAVEEEEKKANEDVEEKDREIKEKTERNAEDVHRKKPKKRKHSKERSEKSKFRKADDERRLLSDECREESDNEKTRKRHSKKKRKKSKREEKRKSSSSGHHSDSSSQAEQHEKRKKHKKSKKKKKKKKRQRSGSSEMEDKRTSDSGKEHKIDSRKDRTRNEDGKVVKKAKELVNNLCESTKKKDPELHRPLVQYSDHSSSSDETTGEKRNTWGSSRSNMENDERNRKNKVSSRSCEEFSSPSGRFQDSHERKRVVNELLEKSRGTSNYGCEVERWDSERDVRELAEVKKNTDEPTKRKMDVWDEDYDRGKVKRTKGKDSVWNRTYPSDNRFQKEYDRRRMRNNGWHYSSSSYSSRRHNRSSDRHSRRDRR